MSCVGRSAVLWTTFELCQLGAQYVFAQLNLANCLPKFTLLEFFQTCLMGNYASFF